MRAQTIRGRGQVRQMAGTLCVNLHLTRSKRAPAGRCGPGGCGPDASKAMESVSLVSHAQHLKNHS